jgi:Secretion system C-terminal sorting domain
LPPTGGTYMPTNQAVVVWFYPSSGNTIGCGNSAMLQAPPPVIDPRDISIATQTYIPQLYTEGLIWQGGKELLEKLDLNPALLANNSLMLDFKDSIAYTPTQTYWDIQKARELLEKGDIVQNDLLQYYSDIATLKAEELYTLDSIYTHDSTALNTLQYTTQKAQYEADLKATQSAADVELSDKLALAEQQADDLAIDNTLATYEKQAEENLHKVNAIYLGSFAKQSAILDETDYAQLYEIATQCPYSGGEGVYQARALLAAIRQPVYDDIAACEQQTIDWKLMPVGSHKALTIQAVPNPASDEVTFYLDHSIPNETTQLSLYDALGKPVGNYTFSGNTLHCDISHLAAGLYYYQAQVGTVSLSGKLSILKP